MRLKSLLTFMLLLLLLPGTASAREIMQEEECVLPAGQVVQGDLFALCWRSLRIDGVVEGSLFSSSLNTIINGEIRGNIYAVAGIMDIYGHVNGDIHYGGIALNIYPPQRPDAADEEAELRPAVDGGLLGGTLTTTLHPDSWLRGGIVQVGYQLVLHGRVDNEISFWGSGLFIDAPVGGDVYTTVGNPETDSSQIEALFIPFGLELKLRNPGLVVTRSGSVEGQLLYSGPAAGIIEGELAHPPQFTLTDTVIIPLPSDEGSLRIYSEQVLREFSALLVIGVLGLLLMPATLQSPIPQLQNRPVSTLSVGMLVFILSFPIVLMGLLLSLFVLGVLAALRMDGVLVVAGILLGVVNLGGTGIFYFVAIFVTRVIVGLALGRWLVRLTLGPYYNLSPRLLRYLGMFVGVLLLSVLGSLPVVGWAVNAVALFLGLGAVLIVLLEYIQSLRDPELASLRWAGGYGYSRPFLQQRLTADLPLLVADVDGGPPGMENLPEGFDFSFWDDDE